MARFARKQLADLRALEEQAERENVLEGSGATPSMGLSQVRGGRKYKKAKNDAEAQGHELAEHLHSLHGGAYMNDFMSGMAMAGGLGTGRYEGEGMSRVVGGSKERDAAEGLIEMKKKGVHHKLPVGKQSLVHFEKPRPAAEDIHSAEASRTLLSMKKKNPMEASDIHSAAAASILTSMKKGRGKCGAGKLEIEVKHGLEGEGRVDGRKARSAVVKQIMAEKGLSMIEASKYVKEHGLYKGGAAPRKMARMADDAIHLERRRTLIDAMNITRELIKKMPLPAVKKILESNFGRHIASEALVELGLAERD